MRKPKSEVAAKPTKRSRAAKIPVKPERDTASFSLVKDGFKHAMKIGVQGGMEFEFASDINHEDFAKKMQKALKIPANSIRVLPTYVSSAGTHKDYSRWSVESDTSIDTDKTHTFKIEVVTPVMSVKDMVECVDPMFALIKLHGLTSSNTGLHMTLSAKGKSITRELDAVKLLAMVSEHYVAEEFNRTAQNQYAKRLIPSLIEKVQTSKNFGSLRETIEFFISKPHLISSGMFGVNKYLSMNFSKAASHNVVEFRLPGGANYETKGRLTKGTVSRFAGAFAAALDRRAFLKEYIKTLMRLYYDAKPAAEDPLLKGIGGKRNVKWLVKSISGGKQYALVDVSDGPPQKTSEWAESHLIVKIVAMEKNGVLEVVGSGEGSGWNPAIIETDDRITDRRLVRIKDHVLRNKNKYKREVLKEIKKEGNKLKKNAFSGVSAADFVTYILKKLGDPNSGLAIPSSHMARQYLGIHITPEVAKYLLMNPAMTGYVTWYFTDAILKGRLSKFPRELLHSVVEAKKLGHLDYAESAAAYIKTKTRVPKEIFEAAVKAKLAEQFVRAMFAAIKHYKLEDANATAAVQYGAMLVKNPSKQQEIIDQYEKLYSAKAKTFADPEKPKAPETVSTRRSGLKANSVPALNAKAKKSKPKKGTP